MGLCLYLLTVLKGEADIVGAVDSDVIHQRVPVSQIEPSEWVRQGFEALKEGFNVRSLGLYPSQFCNNSLKALLCGFEALCQAVIVFQVFGQKF